MPLSYVEIDKRAHVLYNHLEKEGIPVYERGLLEHRNKCCRDLKAGVDKLEEKFKFRPDPNKSAHYAKIATVKNKKLPSTPTGRPKTDEITIERTHDEDLIALNQLRKVRRKISVADGIRSHLKSGRVHPTYSFKSTLGRVHQGGDVKCDNWEEDLQHFLQLPGYDIVVSDYKRIELKVLAYLSGDLQLQEDLKADPYLALAKYVYNINDRAVLSEERGAAKTAMIALLYGNTEAGIAAQLHVRRDQAAHIMNRMRQRYPVAFKYLDEWGQIALRTGKIISYHDRVFPVDNTKGEDYVRRIGYNNRQQNTAGDLAKLGFCNLYEDARFKEMGLLFFTTVHDSCILGKPYGIPQEPVNQLLTETMVGMNDPFFDLEIEIKVGSSWGSAKEVSTTGLNSKSDKE